MLTSVVQLTQHQFSHIFVNHSFTVCLHKQLLLFANSYSVHFPVPSVTVCWHSNIGKDSFFKFSVLLRTWSWLIYYRSTKLQTHATLIT